MDIVTLTLENLDKEHICCAISNSDDCQVASKKAWLKERLKEGLIFKKCDVRGKCFIEYIPAEKAWAPIEADGYMYIDCLWVSGKFKSCAKDDKNCEKGFVLYYTSQCPFTAKYVPIIEQIAVEKQLPFQSVKLETCKMAQEAPSAFTTYTLFYNGEFITHEILSDKKFLKLLEK